MKKSGEKTKPSSAPGFVFIADQAPATPSSAIGRRSTPVAAQTFSPSMKAEVVLMSTWVAVETLTIGAAGFGVGPFVELVANDRGEADGHTRFAQQITAAHFRTSPPIPCSHRRFAAFLGSLMLLNVYGVATALGSSNGAGSAAIVHTVLVADEIAMAAALAVESVHGDRLAVAWHVALLLGFGALLARGK